LNGNRYLETMSNRPNHYIDAHIERFTEELFALLRIPSVSTDSRRKGDVLAAAEFLKNQFTSIGLEHVTIFETPGHPIVYGDFLHAPGKPTVLVYGHYDVQPAEPLELWTHPAFEPTVVGDDVYARGASDDKGQAYIHVKAIESWLRSEGSIPVNVKIILEGEEEIGSPNLIPFLTEHRERLACDMVLVSDTSMFDKDVPSITYGLRGLAYMQVEVTGANRDLHSGVYGGAVANPINALAGIIAGLKDEHGRITIPGFYDDVADLTPAERDAYAKLPFDEDRYKRELGLHEVTGESGYSTLERASARPTLDCNGIWGGYQGEGAKTVLPGKAAAKISMRLVPDQDPHTIAKRFSDHVRSLAPPGVTVEVHEHHGGMPAVTPLDSIGMKAAAKAFSEVYGKEPLFTREGGSIPIVAAFKRILSADTILMGFGLNSDAIHAPNEKFSLTDFRRGIHTSATFFRILGDA
jgi:acetylornithine deacetylase/succinyl-diaminopimelate desuccinylase-like protein